MRHKLHLLRLECSLVRNLQLCDLVGEIRESFEFMFFCHTFVSVTQWQLQQQCRTLIVS